MESVASHLGVLQGRRARGGCNFGGLTSLQILVSSSKGFLL